MSSAALVIFLITGWSSTGLLLYNLVLTRRRQHEQLRDIERVARDTIEDFQERIRLLQQQAEMNRAAYHHMRYCRLLLQARPDETLADAIMRVTGIASLE